MLNICGIVAAILKMATGRNCSMSGHRYLPTYQMKLKSDNVEFVHFQNDHRNTTQIQHCPISKVALNVIFKPVVSGRFGRLHNR
jgi:hypothetical protein